MSTLNPGSPGEFRTASPRALGANSDRAAKVSAAISRARRHAECLCESSQAAKPHLEDGSVYHAR